jgi:hypothetical protein
MKTVFIFFKIIFVLLVYSSQVNSQVTFQGSDSSSFHDTLKENRIINTPRFVAEYKQTSIWLDYRQKMEENTYPRLNFMDQYLETWNDRKIFPASLIFAFSQDGKYYRSANPYKDRYVFAEKLISGYMNLYAADKPLIEGEMDVMSLDANHPDYKNRMFVENSERKKIKKSDYFYFITFGFDSMQLKEVNLESFDNQYLKLCQPASDYFRKNYGKSKSGLKKPANIFLGSFLLVWSAVSVLDRGSPQFEPLHKGAPIFFIAMGALITINLIPSKNEFDKSKMIKTIALYNGCH